MAPDRESDPLGTLSATIADGQSIDWEGVRSLAGDNDELRALLEHLRVVEAVAGVYRSQVAETPESRAETTDAAVVEPSERWGHLLLVRKIGEGNFGEVYAAHDTWLDHPRALKLLKPQPSNRTSASQLLHEARKLVRVRHPNVVTVHGADSHDGRVGFWMDLIRGETLEQRVAGGLLSPHEASYVGQELCGALAAVHAANLVHRDIKAQNVMRASDDGRIILMDFGAGEFLDVPSPHRPQGTPLYLAPELLMGDGATIQSDIYALGVLLYYLVTGQFPLEGRSVADLALAHAQRTRRRLRDVRPDLPDGFIRVVERAIDHEPSRRFQSTGDFHDALQQWNRSEPVPAPDTRLRTLLVAGIGLLLLAGWMGLLACRIFEAAMHLSSEFGAGPLDYLRVGMLALVPFAIYLGVGGAVMALLPAVWRPVRPAFARFAGRRWWPANLAPDTVATLVPVAGGLAAAALVWWHRALFSSIATLQSAPARAGGEYVVLDRGFFQAFLSHSNLSAMLCVVLVLAAWRYWPRLERHAGDPSYVRRMKWVALGIALALASTAIAPRRLAFDRFEVVTYENRPAFVIGTSGGELSLYAADRTGVVRLRVPRQAVVSTNTSKRLVEGP